jgi:phage gp29-like protein
LQKAINWAVELNYGKDAIPPTLEFDVERKADFVELMSAIEKGIPVSRSALYDQYKLPQPRDEEDTFIKQASPESPGGFGLADTDAPGKKKARRIITIG